MPTDPATGRADSLPSDLAAALDRSRGRLGAIGRPVLFFSNVGSTNDVAAAMLATGDRDFEGLVVLAEAQHAGRGRHGRRWFSPPAGGLYVSVILTPSRARTDPHRAASLITLAAGVALVEGIGSACGLTADLKWPNDLLSGGRKLAGILAEGFSTVPGAPIASVVLGFGINVGPMHLPPELAGVATSLEIELGKPVDRAPVFVETLAALGRRYEDLISGRFDAILDAWRAHASGAEGRRVSWDGPDGRRTGITIGIDETGALLVRTTERLERIVSGEVEWT